MSGEECLHFITHSRVAEADCLATHDATPGYHPCRLSGKKRPIKPDEGRRRAAQRGPLQPMSECASIVHRRPVSNGSTTTSQLADGLQNRWWMDTVRTAFLFAGIALSAWIPRNQRPPRGQRRASCFPTAAPRSIAKSTSRPCQLTQALCGVRGKPATEILQVTLECHDFGS